MCLEFSHVENSLAQWVYNQYSFQLIPVFGQIFASQWKPYQYLVESIRQFPDQVNKQTDCSKLNVFFDALNFRKLLKL